MTRNAQRVHTDAAAIARLESLIAALPNGARVALQLDDGSQVQGVVAARPVLQVFFDAHGREGSNAVLRIEPLTGDPFAPSPPRDLWLDSVVAIGEPGLP